MALAPRAITRPARRSTIPSYGVYGDALTSAELGTITEELDDLLLSCQIDLSIFNQIAHEKLREHIERVEVVFYEKGKARDLTSATN